MGFPVELFFSLQFIPLALIITCKSCKMWLGKQLLKDYDLQFGEEATLQSLLFDTRESRLNVIFHLHHLKGKRIWMKRKLYFFVSRSVPYHCLKNAISLELKIGVNLELEMIHHSDDILHKSVWKNKEVLTARDRIAICTSSKTVFIFLFSDDKCSHE